MELCPSVVSCRREVESQSTDSKEISPLNRVPRVMFTSSRLAELHVQSSVKTGVAGQEWLDGPSPAVACAVEYVMDSAKIKAPNREYTWVHKYMWAIAASHNMGTKRIMFKIHVGYCSQP